MFKRSDPLMPVSIYLATWNILSRPPEEDLKPLLGLENVTNVNLLPDIYAIGLQEVKAAAYSILMDTILENPWVKALRLTLAPFNYVKIRMIRLQGMLLAVFIKRPHLMYVQELETEYTRTGVARVWGNKGAVSIRLNAFNCSICIVNCHLAAHDTELKRRVEDYNNIVDSQLFKYPQTENIFFHDYVFWLGDMNFRLDSKPLNEIISKIEQKDYSVLLEDDQLRQVRQSGEAFSELEEPPIDFAPTYKFVPGTHDYDIKYLNLKKKSKINPKTNSNSNISSRRPAWTDRILHKVNADVYEDVTLDAQMKNYKAHNTYTQSDHKPVSALYSIKVFQSLPERYVQFAPIKRWNVGKQYQVTLFLRAGNQTQVWDWIGLYK
uniref:Inositol polyphosphate-related phosphatase domain-containing protein n=1 Tax=Strigamia maritima TaxID=126957 RepID=T1IZ05_STRMM